MLREHADLGKMLMENCPIFCCTKLERSADIPVTNQLGKLSSVFQGLQVCISLADRADHCKSVCLGRAGS